ncbi:RloB family protein [Campylobacter sp. RM16188]|uniref:RloB family protein n=1 Tax=Campylobacter sp. RM16188 TaxID=1705725 RepID=UPI00155597F7|nr:RloB family protein [Campylobacter sp. RM16188]
MRRKNKNSRSQIQGVIIACEDSVSAPAYFKKIIQELKESKKILPGSFVIAAHRHSDPSGVLKDLMEYKQQHIGATYKDFKHRWIVIDRDSSIGMQRIGHTPNNFNNALKDAKKNSIEVAYSNDSFELWYLLHFKYIDTAITRDDILKHVIKLLKNQHPQDFKDLDEQSIKKVEYVEKIYDRLKSLQQKAIQNAENLLKSYPTLDPANDNPSTRVHELVKILNDLGN